MFIELTNVPNTNQPRYPRHFSRTKVRVTEDATLADIFTRYKCRDTDECPVSLLTAKDAYTKKFFPMSTKVRDLPAHSVVHLLPPYRGIIQHKQYTDGRDKRLPKRGDYTEYISHSQTIRDLRTMYDARSTLEVQEGESWKTLLVADEGASVATLPAGVRVHWF